MSDSELLIKADMGKARHGTSIHCHESLFNPTNAYTFKISFLNTPVHTHIHVLNELTANVLFAVAESDSLIGKAQRRRDDVASLAKVLS